MYDLSHLPEVFNHRFEVFHSPQLITGRVVLAYQLPYHFKLKQFSTSSLAFIKSNASIKEKHKKNPLRKKAAKFKVTQQEGGGVAMPNY